MKAGLTLMEMAAEITRQQALKADYIMDTRRIQLEPAGSQMFMNVLDKDGNIRSLQHHSAKASILWCSAFFMAQLAQLYVTTAKTIP